MTNDELFAAFQLADQRRDTAANVLAYHVTFHDEASPELTVELVQQYRDAYWVAFEAYERLPGRS